MKKKNNIEWNKILTKEFLYEEYVLKRKAINKIAQELECGILRINNKIKEFGLSRKRIAHNLRLSNVDKINRMGFEVLSEYKGVHSKILVKCNICKQEFKVEANKLLTKHTKSCGCLIWNRVARSWKGYKELSGKEFGRFRDGAKKRNIGFFLSIKEVWDKFERQNKKCALSNIELYWDSKNKTGNASIDRIDNTKPYTIDNIEIVHKYINMMKRHHSRDFFIYLCFLVGNNFNNQNNFQFHEKFHLNIENKQDIKNNNINYD